MRGDIGKMTVVALALVAAGWGAARLGGVPERAVEEIAGVPAAEALPALALAPDQKHCLAQAVYFEARGEPETARRAVAAVVLNRTRHPDFPDSICGVVRQGGSKGPCQFSWWCDGRSDAAKDARSWQEALRIAEEMARAPERDPTRGALYFHRDDVHPAWKTAFRPVASIGRHIYYTE